VSTRHDHVIRPLTPADEPLLWEMLYYAIYVSEGQAPPERAVVRLPELARYVRDWGRAEDIGFVALDGEGKQPLGAAWLRLLKGDSRGFGYVDETTPELSVAVLPERRGQGIGTRLLTRLLQGASKHHPAVSLSVDGNNPAVRLYRRLGFEVVGTSGTSLTMKVALTPGRAEGSEQYGHADQS
jgi:ribosomal protein S18 acetylase RimI-like enzyme